MHLHHTLPVLIILLQEGITVEIDSQHNTFVKLCFLPKSAVPFDLSSLTPDGKPSEKFYAVFGNDVMQHKIARVLRENKNKGLKKMCLRADVENVDDNGLAFGKFYGFQNATSNYTCQASKDFPGQLQCSVTSANQKFHEETLTYYSTVNENFMFEINCFKTGQVGWALYSKTPKISKEDKTFYFAHAASLGFADSTNVKMYGNNCTE